MSIPFNKFLTVVAIKVSFKVIIDLSDTRTTSSQSLLLSEDTIVNVY
jgi:hypothetical protein